MIGRWQSFNGVVMVIFMLILMPQPALAISNTALIYQVQTGGAGSIGPSSAATQEYIAIYNNSDQPINVTNWCVSYASASDVTKTQLGCLQPPDQVTHLMLGAHSSFSFATTEFMLAYSGFTPDVVFTSGIAATSGHIRLIDGNGIEADRLGWGTAATPETANATAHTSGKVLVRINHPSLPGTLQDTDNNSLDFTQSTLNLLPSSGLYEEVILIDVCKNIEGLQSALPGGYLFDEVGDCRQDVCANIDGLQLLLPEAYESLDGENCTPKPLESAPLLITELLANAPSYDAGKEFIELFNPNDRPVNLSGYKLQLGPSYSKSFLLPADQIILPGTYRSFSDILTGLVLPNSSAAVRLLAPAGNVVSAAASYDQPAENEAWALIDDAWQFTNQPTPAGPNKPSLTVNEEEVANGLAPCAEGKERNPTTNRCRAVQTAIVGLKACKPGQARSPETNRCRSVLPKDSLVACKPGQIRNPDTNRCRAASSASSNLKPCAPGQERNPTTNRCRKITDPAKVGGVAQVKDDINGSIASNPRWLLAGISVAGALGYAGYEWRREVLQKLVSLKAKIIK